MWWQADDAGSTLHYGRVSGRNDGGGVRLPAALRSFRRVHVVLGSRDTHDGDERGVRYTRRARSDRSRHIGAQVFKALGERPRPRGARERENSLQLNLLAFRNVLYVVMVWGRSLLPCRGLRRHLSLVGSTRGLHRGQCGGGGGSGEAKTLAASDAHRMRVGLRCTPRGFLTYAIDSKPPACGAAAADADSLPLVCFVVAPPATLAAAGGGACAKASSTDAALVSIPHRRATRGRRDRGRSCDTREETWHHRVVPCGRESMRVCVLVLLRGAPALVVCPPGAPRGRANDVWRGARVGYKQFL